MDSAISPLKHNSQSQKITFDKLADTGASPEEGYDGEDEYTALVDYLEYLSDPTAWFVEKEHPCMDG